MKSLIQAVAVAAVLAVPAASFAQSNQPVSRAQVRAELQQLEAAGFKPGFDDVHYPQNLEAAQARIATQNNPTQVSDYGPAATGASQTGYRAETTVSSYSPPIYIAHQD